MLQAQSRLALLRRLLLAAFALVAGGVRHRMRLVEHDDSVKIASEPVDDLLDAARLLAPCLRAQGRVGGEEDAFLERDRSTLPEARKRHEVGAVAADRGPVALGILDQLVGLRDPERAAPPLQPVVEDDRGDLAALAGAGAVAKEPAAPEPHSVLRSLRRRCDEIEGLIDGVGASEMARMRLTGIDDALELGVREDASRDEARRQVRPVARRRRRDRRHRGRLHELRRMRLRLRDTDRLQRVAFVEARRQPAGSALGGFPVAGLIGELGDVPAPARAVW